MLGGCEKKSIRGWLTRHPFLSFFGALFILMLLIVIAVAIASSMAASSTTTVSYTKRQAPRPALQTQANNLIVRTDPGVTAQNNRTELIISVVLVALGSGLALGILKYFMGF